jgi:tetratricopeptide (TPR) repeat protein
MQPLLAVAALSTLLAAAATPVLAAGPVDEQARREALDHFRLGQSHMYAEAWPEAEREFRTAVKLDPLLVLAHYSLGQTYMAMKEYPKAVSAFTGARQAFLDVAALASTDQVRADQRRDDEIRELRDAVRLIRGMTQRMQAQGHDPEMDILKLESRINELETYRRKGNTGSTEVPAEFSLALGSAYFRTGAVAEAQREYEAAVKVRPKFGEAHNNLAVVYMMQGKLQDAEVHLKQAEKAGFPVNPRLKEDLSKRLKGS